MVMFFCFSLDCFCQSSIYHSSVVEEISLSLLKRGISVKENPENQVDIFQLMKRLLEYRELDCLRLEDTQVDIEVGTNSLLVVTLESTAWMVSHGFNLVDCIEQTEIHPLWIPDVTPSGFRFEINKSKVAGQ
jgi:hypothetical protein